MTVATMAMLVAALMWTYVIGQIVRVVAALTERSSKMDGMMDDLNRMSPFFLNRMHDQRVFEVRKFEESNVEQKKQL